MSKIKYPFKGREKIIDLVARNKLEWLRTAESLFIASQILYKESEESFRKLQVYLQKAGSASSDWFPETNTHVVARMLIGMSIENLIKGIILQRYPEKISNGKLNTKVAKHDLNKLLEDFPVIELNNTEMKTLNELTQSISWRGKFPLPLDINHYDHTPDIENESIFVREIYLKLKTKLLEEKVSDEK